MVRARARARVQKDPVELQTCILAGRPQSTGSILLLLLLLLLLPLLLPLLPLLLLTWILAGRPQSTGMRSLASQRAQSTCVIAVR